MAIRYLDPTERGEVAISYAARLESLEGRVVGLLDNAKVNCKQLLDHVETILRSKHGVKHVVRLRLKEGPVGMPGKSMTQEEMVEKMKGCDALISAIGD
jgi:hypothetical protein